MGGVGGGGPLFSIKKKNPYLVVLAAALKAAGAPQIFILLLVDAGCVCV